MPVHPPLLRRSLAPTNLSEIETQATLGIGTFATVSLVSYSVDGELKPYALKTLCKEKLVRYEQIEHTINEAKLLASFHHPFIAKLEAVFESPTACHLLLEPVMGGELFARIRLQRRLSEAEALCYSMMVAAALDYLHARRVAYRDLKPENLLLDERGYLKLVDFGFAKEVVDRTWTLCGTPEYMAPEVILNEGHGVGVDWWALGILFYEMVTGVLPFGGQGVDDHMLWRQASALILPLVFSCRVYRRALAPPRLLPGCPAHNHLSHSSPHDAESPFEGGRRRIHASDTP